MPENMPQPVDTVLAFDTVQLPTHTLIKKTKLLSSEMGIYYCDNGNCMYILSLNTLFAKESF